MSHRCEICGKPIKDTTGKRGRPSMYHKPCAKLQHRLDDMQKALYEAAPYMDKDARARMRRNMFSLLNSAFNPADYVGDGFDFTSI